MESAPRDFSFMVVGGLISSMVTATYQLIAFDGELQVVVMTPSLASVMVWGLLLAIVIQFDLPFQGE